MNTLSKMQVDYKAVDVPRLSEESMQWFRDAKFGMFIHWGLYALLERGEWAMFNERISVSEYAKLADDFTVEKFNPREWARIAKEAGMKYMVLTTRHHDGFSLFESSCNAFNSVNSAAKRDLVKEYCEAVRNEGLKVGFYYSPMDWRYPGYFFPEMYLDNALEMKKQCDAELNDLMTNYGKIDLLWFDGEWLAHGGIQFRDEGWSRDADWMDSKFLKVNYFWESEKMIQKIRELQPGIMINNRFGWVGDFQVRERQIGSIKTDMPWDTNDCIAHSWGYNPEFQPSPLDELIRTFVKVMTRDGNYLLNLGPTGKGDFDPTHVQRLMELGDWLKCYQESIYGTRGGPFLPGEWGGATYSKNKVYLHILEQQHITIHLPYIENPLISYRCLTSTDDRIQVVGNLDGLIISLPEEGDRAVDTIIELVFENDIQWDGVCIDEAIAVGLGDGISD